MKTLLVTLEYPPFKGGVANYYDNLVKFWPNGEQISVMTDENHELLSEKWKVFRWVPAVFKLKEKIKKEKIDHVLVGQILPIGSIAYYASLLLPFKYSVIMHGMEFTYAMKESRKKKMAQRILLKATYIFCSNNHVARLVRDFIVVNPGVSPTELLTVNSTEVENLKKKHILDGKFVILSLGRLVKRKGVDQVIMALERLIDRIPDIVYIVAGTGPDEAYLKNYAQSVSNYFASHIKFIGPVSDTEKWQWLTLCDCMIMPAREENGDFEGFGIVYLEAGLAGKPVIAGKSGGVSDAVEHMVNGIMVEPTDNLEISQAIVALMDDQGLAHRLGTTGRDRAAKEFTWPDKIKIIYDKIRS
jgi:phosphatidyl-myo-inositol dimannoside synthase